MGIEAYIIFIVKFNCLFNQQTDLYQGLVQYEAFISNNSEEIALNMNLIPSPLPVRPISLHLMFFWNFLVSESNLVDIQTIKIVYNQQNLFVPRTDAIWDTYFQYFRKYCIKRKFDPTKPIFPAFDVFLQLLNIWITFFCNANHKNCLP